MNPAPAALEGKTVLITGAASGIGRAAALLAVAQGVAGVVVTDVDEEGLGATVEQLRASTAEVVELSGPITTPGFPDELVELAVKRFGRLDCAVNNAGVRGPLTTIADASDGVWDGVLDVNLTAVFRCLRAQLRQMYRQGAGSVVNVASASVYGVSPQLGAYVASKTGVLGLTRVAAVESGPHGVRVNVVCPGRTDTPLLREYHSADSGPGRDSSLAKIPLGRFGTPDELGQALLWLCSDASSFVNGAVLVVDGGRTVT